MRVRMIGGPANGKVIETEHYMIKIMEPSSPVIWYIQGEPAYNLIHEKAHYYQVEMLRGKEHSFYLGIHEDDNIDSALEKLIYG